MPIDFDDLDDYGELNPALYEGPAYGLIVAERAASGSALHAEEQLYRRQHNLVIFTEMDPENPGREIFLNPAEWQSAMRLEHLPTEDEVMRWIAAGRPLKT